MPNENNTPPEAGQSAGLSVAQSSAPLLTRIQNHLCMMAPDQRDQCAGKLLIESAQELAKLTALLSRCVPIVESDALARENARLRDGIETARRRLKHIDPAWAVEAASGVLSRAILPNQ